MLPEDAVAAAAASLLVECFAVNFDQWTSLAQYVEGPLATASAKRSPLDVLHAGVDGRRPALQTLLTNIFVEIAGCPWPGTVAWPVTLFNTGATQVQQEQDAAAAKQPCVLSFFLADSADVADTSAG